MRELLFTFLVACGGSVAMPEPPAVDSDSDADFPSTEPITKEAGPVADRCTELGGRDTALGCMCEIPGEVKCLGRVQFACTCVEGSRCYWATHSGVCM